MAVEAKKRIESAAIDGSLASIYGLVHLFLVQKQHTKAAKAVREAARDVVVLKEGVEATGPSLEDIVKQWTAFSEKAKGKESKESDSDSSSEDSSGSDSGSSESESSSDGDTEKQTVKPKNTKEAVASMEATSPVRSSKTLSTGEETESSSSSDDDSSSDSSSSDDDDSSSSSSSSDSPEKAKAKPKSEKTDPSPTKIKAKKAESSSGESDSSDSDSDSSSSSSSDSDSEDEKPKGTKAPKAATKAAEKKAESSSDDSSSDSDTSSSDSDSDSSSSSSSSSSSQKKRAAAKPVPSQENVKVVKKRRLSASGAAAPSAVVSADLTANDEPLPSKAVSGNKANGKIQDSVIANENSNANGRGKPRKSNTPFQRVKPEAVTYADPRLMNNAFNARGAHNMDYGAKASKDLLVTRGAGFRKEKNKKKRGSYRGGDITMQSYSIKFND